MAENPFRDKGAEHSEGMPARPSYWERHTVEAVPLSYFQVVVRNEFNLIPNKSGFLTYGFPTHVDLDVGGEATENPGNPTGSDRLMLWVRSNQPENGPHESFLMSVTLPSDAARQLGAALIREADLLDKGYARDDDYPISNEL